MSDVQAAERLWVHAHELVKAGQLAQAVRELARCYEMLKAAQDPRVPQVHRRWIDVHQAYLRRREAAVREAAAREAAAQEAAAREAAAQEAAAREAAAREAAAQEAAAREAAAREAAAREAAAREAAAQEAAAREAAAREAAAQEAAAREAADAATGGRGRSGGDALALLETLLERIRLRQRPGVARL